MRTKEAFMKSLVIALAALPFMAGAAGAAQPLNDWQMDGVTAGYTAGAFADAEGLVGESGIVLTTTATLAQVSNYAVGVCLTCGAAPETATFVMKSISAAASSTVTSKYQANPLPTLTP
jgi:hypothetical protein